LGTRDVQTMARELEHGRVDMMPVMKMVLDLDIVYETGRFAVASSQRELERRIKRRTVRMRKNASVVVRQGITVSRVRIALERIVRDFTMEGSLPSE